MTEQQVQQPMAQEQGYVHIYAGDGKGKTTAATGLAVRAAGREWRVLFVQFLKSGNSAELRVLRELPTLRVISGQKVNKFSFQMSPQEKELAMQEAAERLATARSEMLAGRVDLLVLDEALGAVEAGILSGEQLCAVIRDKPKPVEIVLTGRNPAPEICDLADYYSEICERKHPYRSLGLDARPGIEF